MNKPRQYLRGFLISFLLGASCYVFANQQANPVEYQQFIKFLENKLESENVNPQTTNEFFQRSWAFWQAHKLDYNQHPEKYHEAISLFYKNKQKFKRQNRRDVSRYQNKIDEFSRFDSRNSLAKDPILFVGSSSIAGWETALSFPELAVINRGLGGMSVPEIIHYYDHLIKKHAPDVLVVYSDIDIENGKSPKIAVEAFKTLVNMVHLDFPETQVILLSLKPALIDDFLGAKVRKNKATANQLLMDYANRNNYIHFADITAPMIENGGKLREDIFVSDGMHLNDSGYALWAPIVKNQLVALGKAK